MRNLALIALAALCACKPTEKKADPVVEKAKPIEGYKDLKFGATLTEAMGIAGPTQFNPSGLADCLEDLPLKGCFLSADRDAGPYVIKAGIPYRLGLDFNKYDKLTDIFLAYNKEGGITADQCRDVHERTLDWLVEEYGYFERQGRAEKEEKTLKTSKGVKYPFYPAKDGAFIAGFMRTAPKGLPASVLKKPIGQWNNDRYIALMTYFILVSGKPICDVSIYWSEPLSVERRPNEPDPPAVKPEPTVSADGATLETDTSDYETVDANGDAVEVESEIVDE